MERGEQTVLYVIGENPVQSEADAARDAASSERCDFLVVQDIFLTATASWPTSSCPRPRRGPRARAPSRTPSGGSSGSARRSSRRRGTRRPVDHRGARPADGRDWGWDGPRTPGTSSARSRPSTPACRTGVSRSSAGSSGRATTRTTRASCSSTAGSGRTRCPATACRFVPVEHDPRSTELDDDFPIRLTTGPPARLVTTPASRPAATVAAAARRDDRPLAGGRRDYGVRRGRARRIASRAARSSAVSGSTRTRPGLAFMTPHFPDDVETNNLTSRRDGSEVGHGRVQGDGHPDRQESIPRRSAPTPKPRSREVRAEPVRRRARRSASDDDPGPDQHRQRRGPGRRALRALHETLGWTPAAARRSRGEIGLVSERPIRIHGNFG
jgi:formate dehydrogenase major subunit